jgi:hypothetical protein
VACALTRWLASLPGQVDCLRFADTRYCESLPLAGTRYRVSLPESALRDTRCRVSLPESVLRDTRADTRCRVSLPRSVLRDTRHSEGLPRSVVAQDTRHNRGLPLADADTGCCSSLRGSWFILNYKVFASCKEQDQVVCVSIVEVLLLSQILNELSFDCVEIKAQ